MCLPGKGSWNNLYYAWCDLFPLTFLPANVSVFKVSRVRNVIRAPVSKGELGWLVNSGLSSKTTVLEDASHFPPTLPKGLVSFPVET